MYFMSVLGVLCNYYFNLNDLVLANKIFYVLFLFMIVVSHGISVYKKFNFNFILALFPFAMGVSFSLGKMTLIDFTVCILIPFLFSIFICRLSDLEWDKYMLCFFALLYGVFFNNFVYDFTRIFIIIMGNIIDNIMGNINDFFILSLTIILLGATLSLLAFTYYMVLDKDDTSKKEMKSIGENFFISTLFSMFFLIIVFVFTRYCTQSSILSLGNINFIEPYSFIMVNIFVILLFLFLYTLLISLKYLLGGIFASLNNLPFKF